MELRKHPHLQGMVIAFDIQTFTVSVSYVCVRKNNGNKKDFILSVKELCSFTVELLISYTAHCVNVFRPLKDTSLQLGRRM
jgi:hypothetical protein